MDMIKKPCRQGAEGSMIRRLGHLAQPDKLVRVKARFDDHVITVKPVTLSDGSMLPEATHGFVIEAFASPEAYEVEFDLGDDQILATVRPEDFGVA